MGPALETMLLALFAIAAAFGGVYWLFRPQCNRLFRALKSRWDSERIEETAELDAKRRASDEVESWGVPKGAPKSKTSPAPTPTRETQTQKVMSASDIAASHPDVDDGAGVQELKQCD